LLDWVHQLNIYGIKKYVNSENGFIIYFSMEIKSNIGYEQLIAIINQLPIDEVNRLKAEIEKISSERTGETGDNLQSLIADE